MSQKVLITYATKLGSTTEVARAIGETISKKGIAVDVLPIKDVAELSGYDAVIIGSAIRMGSWLPEAVNFVQQNRDQLNKVSTRIFSVHILNQGDSPESQKERQAYTAPLHKLISPEDEAFFSGKIDPSQLKFVERLLFKAVKSPNGDFRDWEKIQNWAAVHV
jgi:menaquinone-dependent protoporphyrinogen oxidase